MYIFIKSVIVQYNCTLYTLLQGNRGAFLDLLVAVDLQRSVALSQEMLDGGELFGVDCLVLFERQAGHLCKRRGVFRRLGVSCSDAFSVQGQDCVRMQWKMVASLLSSKCY